MDSTGGHVLYRPGRARHAGTPCRHRPVLGRYICALTCKYPPARRARVLATDKRREGGPHTGGTRAPHPHRTGAPSRRHGGTTGRKGEAGRRWHRSCDRTGRVRTQPARRGIQSEFSCKLLDQDRDPGAGKRPSTLGGLVQRQRTSGRCQRSSVPGVTSRPAHSGPGSSRARAASTRSAQAVWFGASPLPA